MSKGSQGSEEDPIVLSLRSEINGLDPDLISEDPRIEVCLRDLSSASHPVGNVLAELIKVIHESGENCKSSTSQSSDNKNVIDPQDKGESDFLAKESGKLIKLLITEKVKEYLSTCFQQPNGKGKDVSVVENVDENHSRQQKNSLTTRVRNLLTDLSMESLQMRYDVLGPLLKHCLLFLSIFPEKEFIKKRSLIYWWIGEGWVRPSETQTAEEVGQECFKMLVLSGLIQPVFKKHDKHARGCVIDPSVKKMLVSNAADTNFFAFDSQNKNPIVSTQNCKRACLVADKEDKVVEVSLDPKPENLRSLFNINVHYMACAKNKFSSLESIVVLQLGRWQYPKDNHIETAADHHIEPEDTKFLDNLGVMKNLTYLSLQGISKITKLPDSCVQLTKLQILDLRGCHHLERLPNEIEQLKNLTHFDVSECPFLERMPKGLSSLSKLQVLKGFVLNNEGVDGSCKLGELVNLKKLQKLSIKALALAPAPNYVIELDHFSSLRSLSIIYWVKNVLSSLTFPENLEKLDLNCIPDIESPGWLKPEKLRNLKKLYIRGGKLKSLSFGSESEKWNVETLRLRFLHELERLDRSQLKEAFPPQAFIEIYDCPKLEAKPASARPLVDKDNSVDNEEVSSSDMPHSGNLNNMPSSSTYPLHVL